jgi:hypothetical protein
MKAQHGRHGVPPIYDKTVSEILSANFNSGSPAMMVMPTVSGSVYRISVWKAVTRAATTSWTIPWLTIGWMDDNSITRNFTLLVANSTEYRDQVGTGHLDHYHECFNSRDSELGVLRLVRCDLHGVRPRNCSEAGGVVLNHLVL